MGTPPYPTMYTPLLLTLLTLSTLVQVECLVCYKCGMIPICNLSGGKDPAEPCKDAGAKFCEVKFNKGTSDEKGCGKITEVPKGYKHVTGDPDKQCKVTHNKDNSTTTHCYCTRDKCNHDVQAYTPQPVAGAGQEGGKEGSGYREAPPQGAGAGVLGGGVGVLVMAVAQYFI